MPNLNSLSDFIALNIGSFEKGKWDYIALAQLYPQLEVLGQLVPRKQTQNNKDVTIVYQMETDSTGAGAKAGDPITLSQQKKALRRKVGMVKYLDHVSWTLDQDELLGQSDEHIVRQMQMDLVAFDLHFWQDLEHGLLKRPATINPEDSDPYFGFPAWITDDANIADGAFELYGGDDPYATGRPGGISVVDHPKYTNPVAEFNVVSDDSFFDLIEEFLIHRKLMGAVPNPRLLPDTPNDVCYVQSKVARAIQRYMQASNQDTGMDAGRYRGAPSYKDIPFHVWHAAGHPDSPVADATCVVRLIDWNSFNYRVHSAYDRKIEGPEKVPLVPGGRYITSELWHQLSCDRPDRNLYMKSDNPAYQPA